MNENVTEIEGTVHDINISQCDRYDAFVRVTIFGDAGAEWGVREGTFTNGQPYIRVITRLEVDDVYRLRRTFAGRRVRARVAGKHELKQLAVV